LLPFLDSSGERRYSIVQVMLYERRIVFDNIIIPSKLFPMNITYPVFCCSSPMIATGMLPQSTVASYSSYNKNSTMARSFISYVRLILAVGTAIAVAAYARSIVKFMRSFREFDVTISFSETTSFTVPVENNNAHNSNSSNDDWIRTRHEHFSSFGSRMELTS
jgi:hypothetical protein